MRWTALTTAFALVLAVVVGPSRSGRVIAEVPIGAEALDVVQTEPAWQYLEEEARVIVADMFGVSNDATLRRYGKPHIEAQVFVMLLTIVDKDPRRGR